jgi:hypothetical protein
MDTKPSRFTEERIIGILAEPRAKTADICRKHRVNGATFYNGRPSTAASRCRMPSG